MPIKNIVTLLFVHIGNFISDQYFTAVNVNRFRIVWRTLVVNMCVASRALKITSATINTIKKFSGVFDLLYKIGKIATDFNAFRLIILRKF